ncbi:polysaccharide biosynthesis protein [Marinobacter apostichopi]|uniref:polysaccharide biosynthesis protein n=1 Tax=Marinobacter apostichopi TaxID=3035454 RepID=UPI002572BDFF|nr:polysaccharide biosynthesis protein [Marinobacter sp. LA51]
MNKRKDSTDPLKTAEDDQSVVGDEGFSEREKEQEQGYWSKSKDESNGQGVAKSEWDDSRMLVPSSLELGAGTVDKYVISKQIVRMKEPRRLTPDDMDERRIIYPESSNRALVNRFRDLRTKLLEASGSNNFTIVVSSTNRGAGASFVSLNLAAAFAFDQSKTAVVIDCNLRDPSLHSTLDILPETGLTDFLDDPDFDIARILYPTGIPRLRLIPAGSRRETPSEFFTSFRMKQFLQAVRRRYPDRFIVLDTAPITDSPDARILSELCDYAMLVVPHGRVTPNQVEQAAIAFNPQKFVGTVING